MSKKKAPSRRTLEAWFEIHELIAPNEARGNIPVWAPCLMPNGRDLYQEPDAEAAEARFQKLPNGTRFRLVLVTRRVVSEKE